MAAAAGDRKVKVQSFVSWLPQTGGRMTPISYGKLKPDDGGGTMAWRVLRVRDFEDVKSRPVQNLPRGIAAAQKSHPAKHFTGGHLLGAAFGGPIKNPKNLTMLSANANKQLKVFEKNIISGFHHLTKAYEVLCSMGLSPDEAVLSVMIKVKTKGEWDKELPDRNISSHLTCKAQLEGQTGVLQAIKTMTTPPSDKLVAEYQGLVAQAEVLFNTAKKTVNNS
ncbi:MAG: hypothetical protein ABI832_10655 [bacterium]